MAAHAFRAPSDAARWVVCTGSAQMQAQYPDQDNASAAEGDAGHWVVAQALRGIPAALRSPTPNGLTVTDEMLDGAELYVGDISACVGEKAWHYGMLEQPVQNDTISLDNWGTPDFWLFDQETWTLWLWDYKFGHGFVEVFENWQLINYVALILRQLNINGWDDQRITVRMRIVQPRCYHKEGPVREWAVKASDLRAHFNTLRNAAQTPNPKLIAGPKQCKDCSARHACPALQRAAQEACDDAYAPLPVEMSADALGLELFYLTRSHAMLTARLEGLQAQVLATISNGANVPHWMLDRGRGSTDWTKSDEEVIMLGTLFGKDLRKKAAITPTQAIKLGVPESAVKGYSQSIPGAVKLAAATTTAARKVFGK